MPSRDECRDTVRQLWPYLDDVLPPSVRELVEQHLMECEGCRSHFDFEREFLRVVRASYPDESTEFEPLRERVRRTLAEHGLTTR